MLELLTGVVVTIAVVALVMEPLLKGRPSAPLPTASDLFVDPEESSSPEVRALLALREIEFDRATGKISEEDYLQLRQQYGRAALDAMDDAPDVGDAAAPPVTDVETAVAAARRTTARACPDCGDRPEKTAIFCSSCGRSLKNADARPRCWICGEDLPDGAKFCAGCGDAVGVGS